MNLARNFAYTRALEERIKELRHEKGAQYTILRGEIVRLEVINRELRDQVNGLIDRLCVKADVPALSQPIAPEPPKPLTAEEQQEAVQRTMQSRNTGPVASTRRAAATADAKQREKEAEQAKSMKDHPAVKNAVIS